MKKFQSKELFNWAEQYLLLAQKEKDNPDFVRTYHKSFEHIYEGILACLSTGQEAIIYQALKQAYEKQNREVYELLSTLTLTSIHRFTYLKDDKDFASTLFIIPCLCTSYLENTPFTHPSFLQMEDIFKKHFFHAGLIEDLGQLHLPEIKISEVKAFDFSYSNWFELHKESLIKSVEINEYNFKNMTLPDNKEKSLYFIPLVITYLCDNDFKEPLICKKQPKLLHLNDICANISQDVNRLCSGGEITFGNPGHCESALIGGLDLLQQSQLEELFLQASQNPFSEILIFPQDNCDMVICVWNSQSKIIHKLLELHAYHVDDDEFIEKLLKRISFYEIHKTYIFEENLSEVKEHQSLDLLSCIEQRPVIVLEKNTHQRHTLH